MPYDFEDGIDYAARLRERPRPKAAPDDPAMMAQYITVACLLDDPPAICRNKVLVAMREDFGLSFTEQAFDEALSRVLADEGWHLV